jgi:hypothetical protein
MSKIWELIGQSWDIQKEDNIMENPMPSLLEKLDFLWTIKSVLLHVLEKNSQKENLEIQLK